MPRTSVTFLPAGDTAVVVQFGERIDRDLNRRVLELHARVGAAKLSGVVESVPTFRSLLVHYDPLRTGFERLTARLQKLLRQKSSETDRSRRWSIPVCYEKDYAPDLEDVAKRAGITPPEVVARHHSVDYHVYMLGFLPGYPYMGDLPESLVLPRRENPRTRVPPGSVAIATTLTAIYSLESPGGWHLIGATPVGIFDAKTSPPALLAPGDTVAFTPIGSDEFEQIRADHAAGRYRLEPEKAAP